MTDILKPLDLEAIEATLERARGLGDEHELARFALLDKDAPALVAEVKRLRAALDGLVKINAEDFPAGPDGRINWSAFPVTFGYAKAYRAALVALGRETE